jgi:hypothetical protein
MFAERVELAERGGFVGSADTENKSFLVLTDCANCGKVAV